jgi:hypothetical protein
MQYLKRREFYYRILLRQPGEELLFLFAMGATLSPEEEDSDTVGRNCGLW